MGTEEKKEIKEAPIRANLWEDGPDGRPELMGSRCESCGNVFFPAAKVCLNCVSDKDIKPFKIPGKGKLYSFTAVKRGLPGFPSPYYLGSIDLMVGPRAIFQMGDCGLEDLKAGMEMEAYIGTVRTEADGTRMIGPLFRPVKKS